MHVLTPASLQYQENACDSQPFLVQGTFEMSFPLLELLEPPGPCRVISQCQRWGGEGSQGAGFGLSEKEAVSVRVLWAVGVDSELPTAGDVKDSGHSFSCCGAGCPTLGPVDIWGWLILCDGGVPGIVW